MRREMKPGKAIDYSKDLERLSLPAERLTLLSNLAIYFAGHGDTERAERYFELAYKERMGKGPVYTSRPINRARQHLIALHLRNASSQHLSDHLNAVTDYAGYPANLDRKVSVLEQAIVFIRRAGYDLEGVKSATALGDWIAGVKAETTGAPVKLVGILARNGFFTAARTIAERFHSTAAEDALSQTVSHLASRRDRFAHLVKLASGKTPELVFSELERAEAKNRKKRFTSIQWQVRKILAELRTQGKPDAVHSFLSASGEYASTVKQHNCRVMLLTSLLTQSISLGDKELFAELKAKLPLEGGRAKIIGNKKCEWLRVTSRTWIPVVTQVWMDGEAAITSFMDDAPDIRTNKGSIGVNYVLSSAAPHLDQRLVAALYLRHAKLLSGAYQAKLPRTLAIVAGNARKTGYDQATFDLLDNAFQSSRTHDGGLTPPENMVRLGLGALFEGRYVVGNLEAKAKLR